jgi:hypothetical protein
MNVYRDSVIPFTQFGGTTMSGEFPNFNGEENWISIYAGEGGILNVTSVPWGTRPPICWKMAMKNGAISSNTKIEGSGSVVGTRSYAVAILANLAASGGISSALVSMGMQLLASITGIGGISSAVAQLLAQIQASLSGSGDITDAPVLAYLNALANLTGTGEITSGDLEGLGELIALLTGVGLITPLLTGTGELTADIKAYGSLTPEGIRDLIWNATASNYIEDNTMGKKLNDAGAASNPWDVIFGTMTAGEMFEAIFKLTHNKVTKTGDIITIYESNGVTVWKQFNLSSGGRVEI